MCRFWPHTWTCQTPISAPPFGLNKGERVPVWNLYHKLILNLASLKHRTISILALRHLLPCVPHVNLLIVASSLKRTHLASWLGRVDGDDVAHVKQPSMVCRRLMVSSRWKKKANLQHVRHGLGFPMRVGRDNKFRNLMVTDHLENTYHRVVLSARSAARLLALGS